MLKWWNCYCVSVCVCASSGGGPSVCLHQNLALTFFTAAAGQFFILSFFLLHFCSTVSIYLYSVSLSAELLLLLLLLSIPSIISSSIYNFQVSTQKHCKNSQLGSGGDF